MNVIELFELAEWYKSDFREMHKHYNTLHAVLQNNATQPTQQPVEEPLENLVAFLSGMDLGKLSLQQLKLLEQLGVGNLVGKVGAAYVVSTVKTATYDPSTTQHKIEAAMQRVSEAEEQLSAYASAVTELGIEPDTFEDVEGRIIVRIGFREDASIKNMSDWKSSSEDWYNIVRGLAMVAGEAPEDTKIIGATNGSVVLVLAATAAVTKLLAMISKHITGIAKNIISVGIARENLRQQKILTKTMETEFTKLEKKTRGDGIAAINKDLAKMVSKDAQGDIKSALEKSITKLLEFGESGGDVDFVAPPEAEPSEVEDENMELADEALAEIENIRDLILEYQEEREAVKLLEDQTNI